MFTKGKNTFKHLMVKNKPHKPGGWGNKFHFFPGTWIDLIFTNNASLVDKVYVAPPFCSTHLPISFDVKYKIFKQYTFKGTVRNNLDVDFQIMNNDMINVNLNSSVFNSTNIHEIYDNFLHSYNKILYRHIPQKVITVRHGVKPFTS